MTNLAHLTTTQFSAYAELHRRGHLWPSDRRAFGRQGRQFARRTLQALVDTGVARWEHRDGVMPHIVPADPIQEDQLTPRGYTIGVPLVVTIHPDGRVDLEVDLSEVPLDESDPEYADEQVEVDQRVLDTVLAAARHHITKTL